MKKCLFQLAVWLLAAGASGAQASAEAERPIGDGPGGPSYTAAAPATRHSTPADPPAKAEPPPARDLYLTGKYAEAAEVYARTATKDPGAVIGLARCLAAQGKRQEAVKTLEPLAKGQAAVLAELADLAFERGDYKEASARADEAVRLDPRQLLGRWVQAELHRVHGRLDEADKAYKWFVTFYNANDVEDAERLCLIGRAAAEYARWNRLADQFDFLVNELYPDALKADPKFWPAHYEAGLLFLEKYNEADAAEEFQKALELNPNAACVHAAMAVVALQNRDVEKAKASVGRALEIDPGLLDGWLVRADLLWANFQVDEAEALLREKALPLCPPSEATLGRLAACYVLAGGLDKAGSRYAKLVAEVHARNPRAGEFYFTLGEWLEARSKSALAERMYREAMRRMPQLAGPQSELGLLYMRAGREAEARKVLAEAFEADPFNVRVNNTLEVLDVLDGMETLETTHLVLRFSREEDKLLARHAAERLDPIYAALCAQFGYTPPGKPLLEIFNHAKGADGHQWFSTRLVGLPYVGTVAASTGHIVAMVSPNDRAVKPYHWLRVMKHELVHVITLQQTGFNCPHWFTEALAVWSEDLPRPQEWNEILVRRARRGKLFDLETINFGFIRPHSSDDWALAYCQSELYLEYMLRDHGQEVVRKLLAAYAEGLSTPEAIRRVCGAPVEEFERGYRRYVEKLAAEMASLAEGDSKDFDALMNEQKEKPDDPDLAAELAVAYLRRDAAKEARAAAEQALKARPKHALAAYVLARLLVKEEKTGEAAKLLEETLDADAPQPLHLNLLAALRLKAEQYEEAARLYGIGEKRWPYDVKWTQALARTHLAAGSDEKLRAALERLAAADGDDLPARKKLAELALGRRDYDAAARWAGDALLIDVKDAESHRALADAESNRRNYTAAVAHYETAIELDPDAPQARLALADACVQAGQTEKAREALRALLKRTPDYPGAPELLESIEKENE